MKKIVLLRLVFAGVVLGWSCQNKPAEREQTIVSGRLSVVVDETLFPVMEEQVAVFEHLYERTDVELGSGHENQIVAQLLNREVEVAVLTRELSEQEMAFFKARKFTPRVFRIATDGVALVANKSVADTVVALKEIVRIMRGEPVTGSFRQLVFDNPNSSTVRLLKSVAGIDSLPKVGVYALKSNLDVLRYVHETPASVGVVGLSWIVRPDSNAAQYVRSLRVLGLSGQVKGQGADTYAKPSQTNLADSAYALARPVYIVNAEPKKSLGMGFAAFLTGDVGQRVMLKAGLMPDSVPPRELIIRK